MSRLFGRVLDGISRFHRALWMANPLVVSSLLFAVALVLLFWASSLELRDAKFLKRIKADIQCASDAEVLAESSLQEFQLVGGGENGNAYLLVCSVKNGKPVETFLVKKVGYLWALNWSAGVCLVFPLIIGLALWSAQSFFQAIELTHRRKMLVKRNELQTITLADYAARFWRRALLWCIVGFAIGFGLVMKDYAAVVLEPLRCAETGKIEGRCETVLFDPSNVEFEREYDWSISSVFPMIYRQYYIDARGEPYFESKTGQAALKKVGAQYDDVASNLNFSTAVYVLNAVMSGIITAFYALLAVAASQVYKFTVRRRLRKGKRALDSVSVMPDLASQSVCKGFETFSPAVQGVLLTCFLGVIAMYFMRVQNLFLRADYSYIGDFFLNNPGVHFRKILVAMEKIPQGKVDMPTAFDDLREIVVMALNDTQAWYALIASVIVIYVSSVFFMIVLRSAAASSRRRAKAMLESHPEQMKIYYKEAFSIKGLDDIKRSLDDMKVWPMAWPNEKKTGLFLLMGIIFLTFYKLFPWFLVACCALVVTWLWRSGVKWLE